MPVLRYFDVVLIVVAAPIMLLIGVSASGYLIGAAAWVGLRLIGVAVDRYAAAADLARSTAIRMTYMLTRLFALAITVILVRQADGQDAGLTCLALVVFVFTISLFISALNRPTRARPR
ncbi:MAG: hypothetical protein QOF83_3297 [Solirubrobacteraceae bacterium]|jgi:hypothetical protein|nr:hypothetical protein [Solirubrobacteraceae bacterium]